MALKMSYDDYWGETYWSDSYWCDSYWAEYGAVLAASVLTEGQAWATRPRPKFPIYLLTLIRDYLESKVKNDG
jgi:hypothetical protein